MLDTKSNAQMKTSTHAFSVQNRATYRLRLAEDARHRFAGVLEYVRGENTVQRHVSLDVEGRHCAWKEINAAISVKHQIRRARACSRALAQEKKLLK